MLSAMLLFLLMFSTLATQLSAQDRENTQSQGDSLLVIEEGFRGATDPGVDYDAYVKELYGDSEALKPSPVTADANSEAPTKKGRPSGPAPGLFKNGRLNGMHIAINGASPFAVAPQLESWYSYIDAGITLKFPYQLPVDNMEINTLFEISTFSFANSFPQGGSFAGMAYIFEASAIGETSSAVMGFGFWDANIGTMMEVNYRIRPTTNTFLRVGTRGVLISNVEPLGATWWLELRFSMGLEL